MSSQKVKLDREIVDFISLRYQAVFIVILFVIFRELSIITMPRVRGLFQECLTSGFASSLGYILASTSMLALFLLISVIKIYSINLKDLGIVRRPDSWSYKKKVFF